jgi:Tol biopolymer transport system component
MVLFGVGVYFGLSALRSHPSQAVQAPTAVKPKVIITGTMVLAQGGSLYKLSSSGVSQLHPPSGAWSQPALLPDGSGLVAVLRGQQFSDLYLLRPDGTLVRQLTHNAHRVLETNNWAFFPHVSSDGGSLYYGYDEPKAGFKVDFAVWDMPLAGSRARATRLSTPNNFSGGDVDPVPLPSGGFIYSKHGFDEKTNVVSQIWLQHRSLSEGVALTSPDQGCRQPALSPDGSRLAMICSHGGQVAQLVEADLANSQLGSTQVLVDGTQAASPAWSPDGATIAFLAPASAQGSFQLWTVDLSGHARRVTDNLDLDATSAPAWAR